MSPLHPSTPVNLLPGQVFFGVQSGIVTTVLGSCIAVVLWLPDKKIGGMCHFLLPSRMSKECKELDGRYADEAMAIMLARVTKYGGKKRDLVTKVYGGARMFPNGFNGCSRPQAANTQPCRRCNSVACKNQIALANALNKYELKPVHSDLGGTFSRRLKFDLSDGSVSVTTVPSFFYAQASTVDQYASKN